MIYTNSCPECGKQFSKPSTICNCGWSNVQKILKTVSDSNCQYHCNNQRCSQLGTISSGLYGHAYWFCGEHWQVIALETEKRLSRNFKRESR